MNRWHPIVYRKGWQCVDTSGVRCLVQHRTIETASRHSRELGREQWFTPMWLAEILEFSWSTLRLTQFKGRDVDVDELGQLLSMANERACLKLLRRMPAC